VIRVSYENDNSALSEQRGAKRRSVAIILVASFLVFVLTARSLRSLAYVLFAPFFEELQTGAEHRDVQSVEFDEVHGTNLIGHDDDCRVVVHVEWVGVFVNVADHFDLGVFRALGFLDVQNDGVVLGLSDVGFESSSVQVAAIGDDHHFLPNRFVPVVVDEES